MGFKWLFGYNFKKDLENKILSLYKQQAFDFGVKEKEIKDLLKEKRYVLNTHILSQAENFWRSREEEASGSKLYLAKRPYLPNLVEKIDEIVSQKDLIKFTALFYLNEKEVEKPIYEDVRRFIEDEREFIKQNLLKHEKKHGPFFIENPLECNKQITKLFKFLESEMDFAYGTDQENFGYDDIWLKPTQIILLKEIFENRRKELKLDCEDMHNFAASHLFAMGVPDFRYRCVMGGNESGGHLTLYVLEDNLKTWRNMEFTPYRRNLSFFSTIKSLPEFGSEDDALHNKNIFLSYDKDHIYVTFNVKARKEDFENYVKKISIEFLKEDFL
jgi:hypothetical protein